MLSMSTEANDAAMAKIVGVHVGVVHWATSMTKPLLNRVWLPGIGVAVLVIVGVIIAYAARGKTALEPMCEGGVVGPKCYSDDASGLSLRLPGGWSVCSSVQGIALSLYNYGPHDIKLNHGFGKFPPGAAKIEVYPVSLKPGQSFEQWLSDWAAPTRNFRPRKFGKHDAVYDLVQNEMGGTLTIVSPLDGGKIVVIHVTPADSSSLSSAVAMLSTLDASGALCGQK